MKCPKCGYLGFEDVARCRNCGHDFTVTAGPGAELPLRSVVASVDDLPDLDLSRPPPADLPLFGANDASAALVQALPHVPATRPPLGVRRATPDTPRGRTETSRAPMLDLASLEPVLRDIPAAPPSAPRTAPRPLHHPLLLEDNEPAALGSRAVAAAIDLLVLAVIDVIVIYFTLQICGLTVTDLWRLPKAPLLAFLLLQNGAYFAAFTAGGQTLGKMSVGIRVVSVDGPRLDLGRSLKRTVLWGLLAIPAGLGFATAWFDADRRGLHDRLTGTRVVRAGAA